MIELLQSLGLGIGIAAYCGFAIWALARGFLWVSRVPPEQPVFPAGGSAHGLNGLVFIALLEVGLVPFFLVDSPWRFAFPPLALIGIVLLERYRTLEVRAFRALRDHGELLEYEVSGKSKPELGPGHPNPRFELTVRDVLGLERVLKVDSPTYHAFNEGDSLRILRDLRGTYRERIVRPGVEQELLRPEVSGASLTA